MFKMCRKTTHLDVSIGMKGSLEGAGGAVFLSSYQFYWSHLISCNNNKCLLQVSLVLCNLPDLLWGQRSEKPPHLSAEPPSAPVTGQMCEHGCALCSTSWPLEGGRETHNLKHFALRFFCIFLSSHFFDFACFSSFVNSFLLFSCAGNFKTLEQKVLQKWQRTEILQMSTNHTASFSLT